MITLTVPGPMVSPALVLKGLTAPWHNIGGLVNCSFIPMKVITGMFLCLIKDTSKSGA
jgi:hypothetical protein